MAPRPQHVIESDPARPPDVTTWNVEPGDVVVVRGVFTREEVRAYVDLVEQVYPDAGLTVIFSPPGVDVERIERMAEGWKARSSNVKTEVHTG
jgi:hypothetical protein